MVFGTWGLLGVYTIMTHDVCTIQKDSVES